ncbi:male accessory gland serine protease inhibitor [Drosophila bipectinata]|uniref:male accessory gland serine protease inhibitor n=1 Tax=Drosophila bipectinata TaxID=42026 RepID=UPI001C8A596A|nr:male accessory gland serine protease inhibitor [Drosophila bipectinata]
MKFLGVAVITIMLSLLGTRLLVQAKPEMCNQQPSMDGMPQDSAACMAFMPTWTYDASKNSCSEFIYGGCGGNSNQFSSKNECEKACKD